jgi:hypothetical protein
MKHQPILTRRGNLPPAGSGAGSRRRPGHLPTVMWLTLVLVASVWAVSHFRPEARMRRATARIVRLVEKSGEESPVALGLAANRLGKTLAADIELDYNEYGVLAVGRQEVVQLFVQVRSMLARVEIERPVLAVRTLRRGEIQVRVDARYRLVHEAGAPLEGGASAALHWRKGDDGWRIGRAALRTEQEPQIPEGWL